jgi:hypothetical protein
VGRPQLGDRTYKVHLHVYSQMDLITGKGPVEVQRNAALLTD